MAESRRVAVVGAGAFGGWTALWLRRAGARVTLLDAWGPGNSRASSGGETRAIRAIYGRDRIYTTWVARALELWREADASWGTRLYRKMGALWMCGKDDSYVRAALPHLAELGLAVETLDPADAQARYPQLAFDGIKSVRIEEDAGTLFARQACQAVARRFSEEGGDCVTLAARPSKVRGGSLQSVELSDGSRLEADAFVFACGPWLPELFPQLLGHSLRISRQEVHYFGTPPGTAFSAAQLPIWIDMELGYYGLPASEHRGFKVADDRRGPPFDPTSGDRLPTSQGIAAAREFVAQRFPGLRDAPLLEARVCQYTNTPDNHLVIDTHPEAENLWLVGGGSGHGFKLGPALGELVARHVLEGTRPAPQLAIERLARLGAPGETIFAQPD